MGSDQGARKGSREGRAGKGGHGPCFFGSGALSGVSPGLPALARALKLQQKASKVGFDWNDLEGGDR